MRKNKLEEATKITDLIVENKVIMREIKCNPEKIIRNACKGISIKYLYILMKLIDFKNNKKNKTLLFYYIYVFYLKPWIVELEKNNIFFDKKITDDNFFILEYLLRNEDKEFNNLINYIEELPSKHLSKLISISRLDKIPVSFIDNTGDNLLNMNILSIVDIIFFKEVANKFKVNEINIESFSESSKTTGNDLKLLGMLEDQIFSLGSKNEISHINWSTFNLNKMVKFCRPSVVKELVQSLKGKIYFNENNLINSAIKEKRFDILYILTNSDYYKKYFEEWNKIYDYLMDEEKHFDFIFDNDIYNFCLHEFINENNIFDLIIIKGNYKYLKQIKNFPKHLINEEILFKNFKNLKNFKGDIRKLPLNDIFESYIYFIINHEVSTNLFIELLDIIIIEENKYLEYDSLYEQTVKALTEVLNKNDYEIRIIKKDLYKLKNNKNQNIMQILSKFKVFISKETQKRIIKILEIIEKNSPLLSDNSIHYFEYIFNDIDKTSQTFIKNLILFEQHELFVEIYFKYKKYINPFIFDRNHENILHIIIKNLKDDSTKSMCLDKYMLIIKDIIFNNPYIIFMKNILGESPISLIFINDNNMTGPLNIVRKVFTFESLNKNAECNLLDLTLSKNNIFVLRYLIECFHININKPLKKGYFYPLSIAAELSKIDLFELLIQHGANPFFKDEYNLDSINYAMLYGNSSFLEYIYKMKMNEICFNNSYLFNLASNKNGFEIFKKVVKEKNIDINMINSENETLLMQACKSDNYEIINFLINHNVDISFKDNNNNTALHHCCINNSINCMNILLQNIYYKSKSLLKNYLFTSNINDDTPLHLAAKKGNIEIVEKLLVYFLTIENNKNIRIKSKGEFLPIHFSIINDKIELSLFLLEALNITDEEIEDIAKDTFYNKIKEFISNKNIYLNQYQNIVNKFIEKLNNDINDLNSDFNYNKNLYKNCEINIFNDIYEFKSTKLINFEILINKISLNKQIILEEKYKNLILKYFNYINKENFIKKIIELNSDMNNNRKEFFKLLDILDKSDWYKYEKLERIVNLFISNILPYIENKYLQDCLDIIDNIINNSLLKNKYAKNFLSWIEVIIISISEDVSQFNIYEIIYIIKDFYEIILIKLGNCGLEILDHPYSNIKFYYFIKQLILLLKNKSKDLCLIQLKNINYMPAIILEENEIKNDPYSIFHYSRLYKNNELFNKVNNILKIQNISPQILDSYLEIINKILNNINFNDITCSLYQCQKKVIELLYYLINNNLNNINKLWNVLKYIENNLIEFCNKICNENIEKLTNTIDINNNSINYIEKLIFKEKKLFSNNEGIFINKININNGNNDDEIIIENSKELGQLREILLKLENSKNIIKFYNFKQDSKTISKKFFERPNLENLVELIILILEGFSNLNNILDINQVLIFANFMLYYVNKTNIKLKGLIGENYYDDKNIIIVLLALVHSLNGKNVDIITPSEYLSEKYIKKYQEIYNYFGIKSSIFNFNLDSNIQIVYGTLQELQLDILSKLFDIKDNYNNKLNTREKNVILLSEINDLTNSNTMDIAHAYSNNFSENYIWVYKPIYNLLKNNQTIFFYSLMLRINPNYEDIINALKDVNNGQYKNKVDLIPKELIDKWINSCNLALNKKNGVHYVKELINGEYKISPIDPKTGYIKNNLVFTGSLQPFLEIKEGIIPNNLRLNLVCISKLVFINYYYQNIFAIGGKIDDNKVYNIYNLDSFDCLYSHKIPKVQEKICSDEIDKFNNIKNYIEINYKNEDCNILVLFLGFSEANNFSKYLNNNKINHLFIYGLMDQEKEQIINNFENEHNLLISTYDCLSGKYFNFNNCAINKLYTVVAFKTPYLEKIYNSLTKIIKTNKKIELNGIIIHNGFNQEEFLNDNYKIDNEINKYKNIVKIASYQNILVKFLNSNICKNLIKSPFFKISKTSFISDCINLFRYRWSEYYDKNKQIINVYEFLNSLGLNDLLFYTNNFDEYIQNEFMNIMIIFNLFFKLKIIHPEYTLSIIDKLKNSMSKNNILLLEEGKNYNENKINKNNYNENIINNNYIQKKEYKMNDNYSKENYKKSKIIEQSSQFNQFSNINYNKINNKLNLINNENPENIKIDNINNNNEIINNNYINNQNNIIKDIDKFEKFSSNNKKNSEIEIIENNKSNKKSNNYKKTKIKPCDKNCKICNKIELNSNSTSNKNLEIKINKDIQDIQSNNEISDENNNKNKINNFESMNIIVNKQNEKNVNNSINSNNENEKLSVKKECKDSNNEYIKLSVKEECKDSINENKNLSVKEECVDLDSNGENEKFSVKGECKNDDNELKENSNKKINIIAKKTFTDLKEETNKKYDSKNVDNNRINKRRGEDVCVCQSCLTF